MRSFSIVVCSKLNNGCLYKQQEKEDTQTRRHAEKEIGEA